MALSAEGGSPFVCGGRQNGDYTDICYKYEALSDKWLLFESMTEPRGWCGYDSSESWGLVMVGGTAGDEILSSVERTIDGVLSTPLQALPGVIEESCVVIIDSDRLLSIGGYPYPATSATLMYSASTDFWDR